jgi:hypothetical protein
MVYIGQSLLGKLSGRGLLLGICLAALGAGGLIHMALVHASLTGRSIGRARSRGTLLTTRLGAGGIGSALGAVFGRRRTCEE